MQSIQGDLGRFRKIVRGKIKENLRKYIRKGEMIGRQGKRMVSIPIPEIETPRFRRGSQQGGGVGQGEGDIGQPIGRGDPQSGQGQAGSEPGEHILEVDISLEELAKILGEELALPNIEPKGKKSIQSKKTKYSKIRRTGPDSLRHFKRTYKEALKRQISSGEYDPKAPRIIPIKDDTRYKSWKEEMLPQSNALIVYMMDVSGSMGSEQKEMVRITAFWIETWLRSQYKEIVTEYIVHDAAAAIVDRETFYHLREGGGTKISSAYALCDKMIRGEVAGRVHSSYPPDDWNIYVYHFSDGDNWGDSDNQVCFQLLEDALLPVVNSFGYCQVKSAYGSGAFLEDLKRRFEDEEHVITYQLNDTNGVLDVIKAFFGKGH